MNTKKKIIAGIMALAVVTTSYTSALAYTPIGEFFHIPASKMETDNFWNKEITEGNIKRNTSKKINSNMKN